MLTIQKVIGEDTHRSKGNTTSKKFIPLFILVSLISLYWRCLRICVNTIVSGSTKNQHTITKDQLEKDDNEILKQISETLQKINNRQEIEEMFVESNKLFEKSDKRVENALSLIQSAFDRIHDKVFNFNNVLIGVYLVLGTFPSNSPKLNIWTVVFPIINLVFLVYIDIRQMEIHRFAAREQEWTSIEREQHGERIGKQTRLSLLALALSIACLFYLIIRLT